MLRFAKMHGCGNDYVYIDNRGLSFQPTAEFIRFVSDRRRGVGSDGLILIEPSDRADCFMRMYNADGSEGKMCGNGIRCVGKYVFDHGLTTKTEIDVDTLSGVKHLRLHVKDGKVNRVSVDMGCAMLEPVRIPMLWPGDRCVHQSLTVGDENYIISAVSMGNPHAVVFVDDVEAVPLDVVGPKFERHPIFPESVNTEFVRVLGGCELQMRVWERGSGETAACGTGACAVVVAAVLEEHCPREQPVTVHLCGGDLEIIVHEDNRITMTGEAVHVFDGEFDEATLA